jgi:type II secretory pathway pseudopilin PulG
MIARPWNAVAGADRRDRRGITIVEMIVVMTVVATMLGLCVLLLQMLMKLDADSRARRDGTAALGRLAEQLRADVHAAQAAKVGDRPAVGPAELQLLRGPDQTIEYRADGASSVVRVESEKGKPVRRERYDVPRSGPIALALDREGDRQFVRLSIGRRATSSRDDPPRVLEIVALVGRDRDRTSGGGKP